MPVRYPPAPKRDLVEIHHGVAVADPFRILENSSEPETGRWVDAENALTRQLLDGPHRQQLVERLRVLHRYPRLSVPVTRGRRRFFTENAGDRNQAVLYVEDAASDGPRGAVRKVIVDPNAIDPDGTTAVTAFEPDGKGRLAIYALSRNGSDAQQLRLHDVDAGLDRADAIEWVKFASLAWIEDGSAFFYTRYPQPGTVAPEDEQYFCQIWLHRVGDSQANDRLVYARPDAPDVVFEVNVTSDGRFLVITSRRGASDKAEVHAVPLQGSTPGEPKPLVTGFTDGWHFVGGRDRRLWLLTDAAAPRGRIVCADLDGDRAPRDVIAESDDKLSLAAIAGGRLVVSALREASDRLCTFDLDGGSRAEIPLPGIGSVVGLDAEWERDTFNLGFTSYTTPLVVLTGSVAGGPLVERHPLRLPIDASAHEIRQAWYRSQDGTRVSMFLVHRRDARLPAPVLMSGYGGFNISLTPAFDPSDFLWLESGGVMAFAHLRGGGEYGEAWHEAGMRERKQNVFDDFIAAGEWLRDSGVAQTGRIAIEGGSNGGLLVGAALVQRPDLFGAVVCRVPVADMLRYHLFTVGRFWIPEYGCADDPQQFVVLYRYSPYHNVRDGVAYPPTLVMTADTDDRVAPGMAKKFAARLQEAVAGSTGGPILLRVETRAGHGAGKSISRQVDEQADIYEFLFQFLTRTTPNEQQRP